MRTDLVYSEENVYVAQFSTTNNGVEYRVVQCEDYTIEKCDCDWMWTRIYPDQIKKIEDAYRFQIFGMAKSFVDKNSAYSYAFNLAEQYEKNGYTLLDGVCSLKFDRPIVQMSLEEAAEILSQLLKGK